jgi:hypothetical protein
VARDCHSLPMSYGPKVPKFLLKTCSSNLGHIVTSNLRIVHIIHNLRKFSNLDPRYARPPPGTRTANSAGPRLARGLEICGAVILVGTPERQGNCASAPDVARSLGGLVRPQELALRVSVRMGAAALSHWPMSAGVLRQA